MEDEKYIKKLRSQSTGLKQIRDDYQRLWIDIRDFLAPRTARIQGEKQDDATRQDLNIINTSPRFAVRALPAGMQSGVTSPMRPWFRLGTPDPDLQEFKPVKIWLGEVERLMRLVMARSNLYSRLKSNYGILGTYGTSCLMIDEDPDDIIRAYDFLMGSFAIATDYRGRVTRVVRDLELTVEQWYERFVETRYGDQSKIPNEIKVAYDRGDYHQKFPIQHIMEPNRKAKEGSIMSENKPWASIWMRPVGDKEAIIQWRGYDTQPFFAPRWNIIGENIYGEGCGEIALGDAKQLQLQEKRGLQVLDKFTHPTMVGDASLKNQRTSNLPGETVYLNGLVQGRGGYFPAYQINNPYLNVIEEKQRQVEQRIDEAFYKNLFLMVAEIGDQPNITATQINTMREEKLMMLGPVLEQLNDDLLDPMIDRVFDILFRKGVFPEPPQEIQGVPLRVEYVSVLAQAQKAMGIGNIERYIGFVGNLAGLDPRVMSKADLFEAVDEYADGTGVPPKLVKTTDEAMNEIAQQAQQAQAQEAMQNMPQMAKAMKDVSEIEVGGENIATQVMDNV